MITSAYKLNQGQLVELDQLVSECKAHDKNVIPIYRHLLDLERPIPCNILYYHDTKLIGFLRTFFFFTGAVEIAIMVHPEFRHKGIAATMLNNILPLIKQDGIKAVTFSSPANTNKEWFESLNFTYDGSEYQMLYTKKTPVFTYNKVIHIRLANTEDIPTLCALDDACFPNKKIDPVAHFQGLFTTPNCEIFVIQYKSKIMGKAHVFREPHGVRLTDIAVFPHAQGSGYGTTLIKYCIKHASEKKRSKVILDVETHNKNALKLYTRLGFSITNAHEYWLAPEGLENYGLTTFLGKCPK